jgi:sugar phosphate permease
MLGYRGAPRNILFLLSAMSFLLYVDRVNLSTAAGPIMKELDLSNTELGVAFSAFAYSYAIFQVIGGWLSDRAGARLTLFLCGLIWVATTIATGFVGGFASLLAVRFVLGIGEGATLPAAGRALASWTPTGRRGFAQGVTHSSSRLGNAITPPLMAFLILTFSWRFSFIALGAVTAIWVVVWFLYFRDDPAKHSGITADDLAQLPRETRQGAQKIAVPWGPVFRRIAPAMLVYFCYGWTSWLFFTWLPTFFLHGYNLDIKSTALFSSAVFFSGVVGDTLGGVLSDRILRRTGNVEAARRNVILLSFLGALVFLAPALFVHDLMVVTSCLAVAFFMLELTIGPIWAVPIDVAPLYAGTASGFVNAGAAIAGIISPVVFGMIIDKTGNWTLPFAGSIGLLLVGCIATFWMKPQHTVADAMSAASRPAHATT